MTIWLQGACRCYHCQSLKEFLISGWRAKTERIREQAWIQFEIDGIRFDQTFMVASGLTIDAMLGTNLLCDYEVTMDFRERCFTTTQNGVISGQSFAFDLTAK